jgi:hypothetical protein
MGGLAKYNLPTLHEELKRIGIGEVSHIVSLTQTARHLDAIAEAIAPQGQSCIWLNHRKIKSEIHL